MRTLISALLVFTSAVTVAFAMPGKEVALAKWQLTIESSPNGEMEIVAAKKFPDQSRRISQPGINIAIEIQEAQVTWRRGHRELYSTKVEVPFGNRYGVPTEDGDITVVRLMGPADVRRSDTIEVEFHGVKKRFDIPVSEGFQSTTQPKLSFRLQEEFSVPLTNKVGPYAKSEIIKTGKNSNRLTVVMMGDGYRDEEITSGKYESDANTALSAFSRKEPWNEILKVSNFYLVKVRSAESGASDDCAPDAQAPCTRIYPDTYFKSTFGKGGQDRSLQLPQSGIRKALEAADKYVGEGSWDAIIVFVNSTKYGGTGGAVATTSIHEYAPEIAVHELGHTVGKLADEYDDRNPGYPTKITEWNVDSNATDPKWRAWLTPGVALPTPDEDAYEGMVGAFEGARYKRTGVYRPTRNCMMRNIGIPFCPVCQEGLLTKALQTMNLYDKISPSTEGRFNLSSRARTFTYAPLPLTEGQYRSTWKVCGRIAGLDVDSITISKEALQSKTSCDVSLKIDYYSPRLKSYNLSQTLKWSVRR